MTSGGVTQIGSDSVEVVLVDRRSTSYGSGWWPSAALKLVAAGTDRLVVGPSGTTAVYRGNGDSVYISPPGNFTILTKTASGWELKERGDSLAKLVFDSNGRLFKSLDQNGSRDSVAYSGSTDQVTALVDPLGKTITVSYDASGKLSTITDPGSRQTLVSINAATNQLTYDSVSSSTSRPYTTRYVYQSYPGTNTVVLTRRIGVIADTTVVIYDSTFKRRPVQAKLPLVQDET
ncbi:MAG: RHS repeat domain-containing protein, partial [Gemmatimonadales bacterium]